MTHVAGRYRRRWIAYACAGAIQRGLKPRATGLVLFALTAGVALAAEPTAPKRDLSYNAGAEAARTPEEQRQTFKLPDGFEIELVAAELEGIGKFITVAWDARMRLWTMTALEYPVDANENARASEALFARGGRDRVVVFDNVYGRDIGAAARPRVFADSLVMPLGVQPYRDGAFVQYGPDLRFYRDADGDGRAEAHEVVLTGFGTQDSHLFPHQFLRQPGGEMFLAQGLFNYSTVRRPNGAAFADGSTSVSFNQCKLARLTLDGARFESVTAGPNNIWGLTTSREGESFLQEANDIGYPVIPYTPGIHVRTGSREKLRPYQPLMPPPLPPAQMGGTGLSGLALAEDRDGLFRAVGRPGAAGDKVFFLANPITGAIQVVRAASEGVRYRYEKLADFATSSDRWFRPVAIHFGPDGALYVVDWYNRIISHNEVPREHPDRDKTRGRIWRIRHRDQPRLAPPNLAGLGEDALVARLGDDNALVARLAWLELGDRQAQTAAPTLRRLAGDTAPATDRRLGALWALEMLQAVDGALLRTLATADNPHLRREAVRIACAQPREERELLEIVARAPEDLHPSVRAALGDGLRRLRNPSGAVIRLAARLGRGPLADGSEWERYEREFDRFLARWAMELHASATRALLETASDLSAESRVLAALAVGGELGARTIAALRPTLSRALDVEEVRALVGYAGEPAVREVLAAELAGASRGAVLRALLELRAAVDVSGLAAPLTAAVRAQLASGTAADRVLAAEVAGALKISGAEVVLVEVLEQRWRDAKQPVVPAVLRALRELATGPVELMERIALEAPELAARDEALAGLAAHPAAQAPTRLVGVLPKLTPTQRGVALFRLSGTPAGARALVAGWRGGVVAETDLGVGTVERLRAVLPDDVDVAALWEKLGGGVARVLRLDGGDTDYVATQLALEGPFTVEGWAKLEAPISNRSSLLASAGQLDLNFHAGQFRAWVGGGVGNIVVARKKVVPGTWTHYAITRDREGTYRLFIDGELDGTSEQTHTAPFTGLDIGRSNPTNGGTRGWFGEFRVWSEERSAREIREGFDRSFASEPAEKRPGSLRHVFAGASWGPLHGNARLEAATDAPGLVTPAEAAARAEKFARFRTLANTRGDPERGRELFTAICLSCHQVGGKGGQLAPALDGVAHTGVEAILRNVLTPSAAMEGAYRTYRVTLRDGGVVDGFFVEENAGAVIVRVPGGADRTIARQDVKSAEFLRRSLMPEGLLEALTPEQVSDLFAHMKSLR